MSLDPSAVGRAPGVGRGVRLPGEDHPPPEAPVTTTALWDTAQPARGVVHSRPYLTVRETGRRGVRLNRAAAQALAGRRVRITASEALRVVRVMPHPDGEWVVGQSGDVGGHVLRAWLLDHGLGYGAHAARVVDGGLEVRIGESTPARRGGGG
ncbi:MAG: hypothetical protein KGK07_14500 [Chloroflexota bacterium]|nr:hypothetical protein [Chloroflexota bacterium]